MESVNNYMETDLGNVSPNPKGEYDNETEYEYLDLVEYEGGSYICTVELGTTVTGTAPVPGKNTDAWQVLTLPGDLTPEYIAMHDEVSENAKQVESSRAAVELSQEEVETAQADVEQMRQDTQEAAESAKESKESASGYAQSAEVSRNAAEEAEQNTTAQVQGFDTHVAEKTSEAEQAIAEERSKAVSVVQEQGERTANNIREIEENVKDAVADAQGYANSANEASTDARNYAELAEEYNRNASAAETNATEAKDAAEKAKKEATQVLEEINENANVQQIQENKEQISLLKINKVDKETVRAILNKKPTVNSLSDFFELQTTNDIYQTKVWNSSYNPSPKCEKLGANAELVCEPSTDTVEGRDDYADKIEFMWWYCNYEYDENGNKIVTAIEGDSNYSESGTVDVGVVGMTFYYKFDVSNSNYQLLSWSTSQDDSLGLVPFDCSVMNDGTIRPYYVISAFPSIKGTDGLLHSQPNGKVERNQSYSNMISNYAKKGANVTGAGASRQTFQYIFNLIKYATKNSQSLYAGVTNWNFQYNAAIQRTEKLTYFPLTASQAANLEVGCYVSVGYGANKDGTLNNDRGASTIHQYADDVKILRIDDLPDGNKAVYLDIDTGFDTMPVQLTDTLTAPIVISSMHMWTGETQRVIGKHDGSAVSNTSGRHSYRVQGVEYALGAYIVASDVVMIFKSDYSKDVYVAPKGVKHSTSESVIKSTYKLIGNIPNSGNGADFWIGDVTIDEETGAWFPSSIASGDSQGMCDKVFAGGTSTSGTREYLQGGDLWNGSSAGVSHLSCWAGLGWALWDFAGCD